MNSIICESNVLKFQNDSINIEEKILRRNFKTLDFEKLRKRRFYVKLLFYAIFYEKTVQNININATKTL